jgi:predicted homoserine dehydrogenase-like protein
MAAFGLAEVQKQLDNEGRPIRTALIGAGSMGRGLVGQIERAPGMSMDVVVDIRIEAAINALKEAGVPDVKIEKCDTVAEAEKALKAGKRVVSSNNALMWELDSTHAIVECTGFPYAYAQITFNAIRAKKHIITLNVEGDVCVGHILNYFAKNAGVVYTGIYGDEPGCTMALFDEAESLGMEIVAAGRSDMGGSNCDWNTETVKEGLAGSVLSQIEKNTAMYASFCDGSKTNEECCMIANATGLRPDVRGMHGPTVPHTGEFSQKLPALLSLKKDGGILEHTGVVENVRVPGNPIVDNPIWVFVIIKANTLYEKLQMGWATGGGGPNRILYTPYHYLSVQAPVSIALAAIDNRRTIAPRGNKRAADVITMAKKDLKNGEVIDDIGGLCATGRIDIASVARKDNFLPFALSTLAKMKKAVKKGDFLTYNDVEINPEAEFFYGLRKLQDKVFGDLY